MIFNKQKLKTICAMTLIFTLCMTTLFGTVGYAGYAMAEDIADEGKITAFERMNPVSSLSVYRDTPFEELDLPDTLRVIMPISTEEKAKFVQAMPQTDDYGEYDFYWYGYVQDTDAQTKFENGETVLYTIYYADGTNAYRIYGNLGDGFDRFFETDEQGNITGEVRSVEVTWDESEYDSKRYETVQRLTPTYSTSLYYDGEVYAEVTVSEEEECEDTHEELPIEEQEVESGTEADVNAENENVAAFSMRAASMRAASETPSQQAVAAIKQYTPTLGNDVKSEYVGAATGAWVDYINTIWMSKLNEVITNENDFQFAESSVAENWKWNGEIANKSGDPANDPMAIPTKSNGAYSVYSVSQLWYVFKTDIDNEININIEEDLDFNGKSHNWTAMNYSRSLKINGKGHTLYNICNYQANQNKDSTGHYKGVFINFDGTNRDTILTVSDITFESAYSVSLNLYGGGLFGYDTYGSVNYAKNGGTKKTTLSNVTVKDSFFYNGSRLYLNNKSSGYISPLGTFVGADPGTATDTNNITKTVKIKNCYIIGCKVYGNDHVCGFATRFPYGAEVRYCFVTDTDLCGTGGHSAGMVSCRSGDCVCSDSFTNINMYSTSVAGGFVGAIGGVYERCFSTGKLEGYDIIGGFAARPSQTSEDTILTTLADGSSQRGGTSIFKNCYTTMLVGMRSASSKLGGFVSYVGYNNTKICVFENCYAAGEVGDYSTDSTKNSKSSNTNNSDYNNKYVGGFLYDKNENCSTTFTNCYYDKQTTGMREWVTSKINTERGDLLEGVTGVLTTSTDKAGVGLTEDYSKSSETQEGFKGFSGDAWTYGGDNKAPKWEQVYPQITNLRWGSGFAGEVAGINIPALVKANSIVSVATVHLDTWDTGYDWSNEGVRSKGVVSYKRTKDEDTSHLGYEYTYDTVREVVSDFSKTTWNGTAYTSMINNGQGAFTSINKTNEKGAINISSGKVNHSGVDWFSIEANGSSDKRTEYATRPIRLVAFMSVEAGESKSLSKNELYDHTADAEFTIIDKLEEDLVVGRDDAEAWATAVKQGYPSSKKYYKAATTKTNFAASEDAWIYTEIWQITDEDGKALSEPKSVRVTGEGTGGDTLTPTEKQWLGELPIGTGLSANMKFEITYYWMLADGRYRSDSKVITLTPGTHTLTEEVYNQNGTKNSTALYLGTVQGEEAYLNDSKNTRQTSSLTNNDGSRVIAAWKKNPAQDLDVAELKIEFYENDKIISNTAVLENPKAGDTITIKTKYYGYREKEETNAPGGTYERNVLTYEPIDVEITYKVEESNRIFYLCFDHVAKIKDGQKVLFNRNGTTGEVTKASICELDSDILSSKTDSNKDENLNLFMQAIDKDIKVTLIVPDRCNLTLQKKKGGTESTEADTYLENVKFQMYEIEPKNSAVPTATIAELKEGTKGSVATDIYTDTERKVALTQAGLATDKDGKLSLYGLNSGKYYYLVETQALKDYAELTQMVRIYLDPSTSKASVQRLDSDGKTLGTALTYVYSNSTESTSQTTLKFEAGDFISLSILNFETIDMPTTGGAGTYIFLLVGAVLFALALTLLYYRMFIYRSNT